MSLWKYGKFQTEIDFTDADFMERLEVAYENLKKDGETVIKTGKQSEIIKSQVACFEKFFDSVFEDGASEKIMQGRKSVELCIKVSDSLAKFREAEDKRTAAAYTKYLPPSKAPVKNRAQRRSEK